MLEAAGYYDKVYARETETDNLAYINTRITPALKHVIGASVLDIGCGLGHAANLVYDRNYLGLDFSSVAIEHARKHNQNANANFRLVDLTESNGDIEKHDTVLLLEVLEHLENTEQVAQLALELAQKRIIITVPLDMDCKGHVHPTWNESDLEALFGNVSCHVINDRWLLAIKEMMPTTVSVCMIVRNEAGILENAIASTRGLADEVVILDTGSEDDTVEIARRLGAKVMTGGDRMHKAESRNKAMAAASGSWVVVLDADERIADPVGLRNHITTTNAQALFIKLAYVNGKDDYTLSFSQMRCWRAGTFEYKYRAHEVPEPTNGWGDVGYTEFVWEHRPPPDRVWKSDYTRDRLLLDVDENPDSGRPLYYLGRQYMYRGEFDKAIETLNKYFETTAVHDRADAHWCKAKCYKQIGEQDKQIQSLYQACAQQPVRREWWGELATIYHERGQDITAVALLKAAIEFPLPSRAYTTHYWYGAHIHDLLARCLWKLKRYEEGHAHAIIAVELDSDNQRLEKNLAFFERVTQ